MSLRVLDAFVYAFVYAFVHAFVYAFVYLYAFLYALVWMGWGEGGLGGWAGGRVLAV